MVKKNSFRKKVEEKLNSLQKKDSFVVRLLPGWYINEFQNRVTYIIWNYYKTNKVNSNKKFCTERTGPAVKITRVK
jgi:hypothetical protein